MQIKYINLKKKSILLIALKLVVITLSVLFISSKIESRAVDFGAVRFPEPFFAVVMITCILMLINWFLESWRWQMSVAPFESISMAESTQIVLGGLAMNWVLPFTFGDALSRVAPMKDKFQATSAMLLNRSIMLAITLLYGLFGSWVHLGGDVNLRWSAMAMLMVGMLLIFLYRRKLEDFVPYFRRLGWEATLSIISISVLRYVVFVFQFYLLLSVFLVDVPFLILVAGIGWIFFIRSILPTMFGGIGVREASGILFFSGMVNDLTLVILPIFLLWIINTVVPSLAGLVAIWKLKFNIAG